MFFCSICQENFSLSNQLIKHYNFVHGYTDSSTFACAQGSCKRLFVTKQTFLQHLKNHEVANEQYSPVSYSKVQPITIHEKIITDSCSTDSASYMSAPKLERLDFSSNPKTDVNFENKIQKTVLSLLTRLYNKGSITNITIQTIVEEIKTFLDVGINEIIKPVVLSFLKNDQSSVYEVTKCMDSVLNAFKGLDSEHLREKYLKDNHLYVAPTKVIIGHELKVKRNTEGKKEYTNVDITGQYISLSSTLKMYLETDDNFKVLVENMKKLENDSSNVLGNFCQGTL